jgi:hypothetical protein
MARYDRTVEWDNMGYNATRMNRKYKCPSGIHEFCRDYEVNIPAVGGITRLQHDKFITKYRVVGSPDVHAVVYNSGHIINTAKEFRTEEQFEYGCGIPNHGKYCTKRRPLSDLREADNNEKFGFPKLRYRSPQFM